MDKRGRGIGNVEKKRVEKCKEDNGGRGSDNSDKVQSNKKGVRFSSSDEPTKMTEEGLPTCQVILTRFDGLISPGSSLGAVSAYGNYGQGGDSARGKILVANDKMGSGVTKSDIRETDKGGPSGKPTLDPANSTQVRTKKYICHMCSKSFGQLGHLNRHARIHTSKRPHRCQLCSKTFKTSGELKLHILIHTAERPHHCQICSQSFGQLSNLKRHIRTHTGERPHKCELCSKSFLQKVHLNDHIRSHTGELPHQCQICSKSFGRISSLNRHIIQTHSTGREYKNPEK